MTSADALPPPGRVVRVARAARQHDGAEMVEARFVAGQSPSLAARRLLLLMVVAAAEAGFADRRHRLAKGDIRQGHKGNERVGPLLEEVSAIRLEIQGASSRGQAALIRAGLFAEVVEETAAGDGAWVEYRFTEPARRLFLASGAYAVLNRAAVMALGSKYALRLYELGCLYAGRRNPTLSSPLPDLRALLGVPAGVYRDWTDLRRNVLDQARRELDAPAPTCG
ncbi:replication initiation protein [Oleisolibacter albus]|uniref:replication initiation protein n=1 Tax=Oleisolibacter albus TaxID=2171757 RepID=UPI000DF15266|nr:replication initiation protein [Oleisolibacter albus]